MKSNANLSIHEGKDDCLTIKTHLVRLVFGFSIFVIKQNLIPLKLKIVCPLDFYKYNLFA